MRPAPFATTLCLAVAAAAPVAAVAPDKIPDPRPKSAVVDATGTLGTADVGTIDSLAIRARAGGELVVVVIDSVDGAVPRQFTTQLFNRWRLDTRERNRGVLLLAAINDRKAEIVLGDGYPKTATQFTDRVMRDVVVARFKSGRPRDAMVEGARALVDGLILAKAQTPQPALAQPQPRPPAPRPAVALPPPTTSPAVPLGLFDQAANAVADNPLPVTGGVGGALVGGIALTRRYLRRRPRTCSSCAETMVRLEELDDDTHLSSGERVEERVGSVDYDVWLCPSCRRVLKLRYGAFFTRYADCPGCHAKLLRSKATTLQAATTSSSGVERVDETCAHCSYRNSYTRSIPRIEESSSSDSSSSSGGSSSGSGSSGSW